MSNNTNTVSTVNNSSREERTGNQTPVTDVTLNNKLHYALINLLSGIVHRNKSDEGNLYDLRKFTLTKAFAKYFSSDDYAREKFSKEKEFLQYTRLQYNLEELDIFINAYGDQIMDEWEKVESLYYETARDSKI